ncbi:MAG: hypothetical protein U9Q77_09700 [Candidatus Marinimicrobia bacterium]|nr:hypothetical protein [Candidatus Neomarinimicrobiota bacterium]
MNQNIPLREIEEKFKELQYYLSSGISARLKLSILYSFLSMIDQQSSPHRFYSYFQEVQEQIPELLQVDVLKFRSNEFLDRLQHYLQMMEDTGIEIESNQVSGKSQEEQGGTSGFSSDTVWIPLVEQEQTQGFGLIRNATIQPLTVQVELRRSDADNDLILFNNYPVNMGDPFYNQALDAVGAAKKQLKIRRTGNIPKFRVMFGFADKEYFYTGESFGLGMSLAVLAQMEKATIQRTQHQISQNAVITGGIDVNGQVRGVSEQSLPAKIEAFYCSPFQIFVHPEINSDVIKVSLNKLSTISHPESNEGSRSSVTTPNSETLDINSETHPSSDLRDHPSSDLRDHPSSDLRDRPSILPTGTHPSILPPGTQGSDIQTSQPPNLQTSHLSRCSLAETELSNLLTSQRVTQKQIITLKQWSQAHIRRNQVMRYAAAILLIAGIGWGSWWFTRDLNPVNLTIEGVSVVARNSSGKALWYHQMFSDELLGSTDRELTENFDKEIHFDVQDIDGDGLNEVLFAVETREIPLSGLVSLIDNKGKIKWEKNVNHAIKFGPYTYEPPYNIISLAFLKGKDQQYSIVVGQKHWQYFPAVLTKLNLNGENVQEYTHAGHFNTIQFHDVDGDSFKEIIFAGTHNGFDREPVVGVISGENLSGSDPLTHRYSSMNEKKIAEHMYYLRFPSLSWIPLEKRSAHFTVYSVTIESNNLYKIYVGNASSRQYAIYTLNENFKLVNSSIPDITTDAYYAYHGKSIYTDFSADSIESLLNPIQYYQDGEWRTNY